MEANGSAQCKRYPVQPQRRQPRAQGRPGRQPRQGMRKAPQSPTGPVRLFLIPVRLFLIPQAKAACTRRRARVRPMLRLLLTGYI
jgi:hypothetical protein